MFISVSRRTDIPAYYADWFFRRLEEGEVLCRNPFHPRQVSRIALSSDTVDGFIFWTKNPTPMLGLLDRLEGYPYYFQVTLTSYDRDIEPCLPSKREVIFPAIEQLANRLGPERVIWRYDPILLNQTYPIGHHLEQFGRLAARMQGMTKRCTISFIDFYRCTDRAMKELGVKPCTREQMLILAQGMGDIARRHGMVLTTCAEDLPLEEFGIGHARCVDERIFSGMTGAVYHTSKDRNQRPACGCVESVDIGAYHTCPGGCRYCYANHSAKLVRQGRADYDPGSPLLCGAVQAEDIVKNRAVKLLRDDVRVKLM